MPLILICTLSLLVSKARVIQLVQSSAILYICSRISVASIFRRSSPQKKKKKVEEEKEEEAGATTEYPASIVADFGADLKALLLFKII